MRSLATPLALSLLLAATGSPARADAEADRDAATLRAILAAHPLAPRPDPVQLRRVSLGQRIGGGVMIAFGVASLGAGSVLAGEATFGSFARGLSENCCASPAGQRSETIAAATGGVLIATGIVSAMTGIVLVKMGNEKRREANTLSLSVGPSGVTLIGRF